MLSLKRYNYYSREQLNNLFNPELNYKNGCGKWGGTGIVRIGDSNDFVFFITLGTRINGHSFKEGITENGVLFWQSQPKQKLSDPIIKKLIAHNEHENNIYFLMRKDKKQKEYLYIGNLAYLSHEQTEYPVCFEWQILEWDKNRLTDIIEYDFAKIEQPKHIVPEIKYNRDLTKAIQKSLSSSSEERLERIKAAKKLPNKIYLKTLQYDRNPDVIAETLYLANGYCQLCKNLAPFIRKKDKTPYLEVHHIIPLSKGGEDNLNNTIALCPNCHRKLHFGEGSTSIKRN